MNVKFSDIKIVESDLSSHLEKGHVRQGVRYLEEILTHYYPKASGKIFISEASSFASNLNAYQAENIFPNRIINLNPNKIRLRKAFEFVKGSLISRNNNLNIARLLSSERLWKSILHPRTNDSRENQLIVVQNIEHIFMPSLKLPRNTFLALRFIGKPSTSNEEDFLNAIRVLSHNNPGKIHIAFENIKCLQWFKSKEIDVPLYHVPWFGLGKTQKESHSDKTSNIILFPGAQRREKGIQDIPEIVFSIKSKVSEKFEFKLQFSQEFKEIYSTLLSDQSVSVLSHDLSHREYLSEIGRASIVILPYEEENYLWTGSGIMADCIAIGTPLIAPLKTAIGYEIEAFSLGRTYTSIAEIPEIIEGWGNDVDISDLVYYVENSKRQTKSWLSF
jgi:hypothetical protein